MFLKCTLKCLGHKCSLHVYILLKCFRGEKQPNTIQWCGIWFYFLRSSKFGRLWIKFPDLIGCLNEKRAQRIMYLKTLSPALGGYGTLLRLSLPTGSVSPRGGLSEFIQAHVISCSVLSLSCSLPQVSSPLLSSLLPCHVCPLSHLPQHDTLGTISHNKHNLP